MPELLFFDNDIAVCVKPRGILSQRDLNGSENMVSLLEMQLNKTVYPLHRLDREVGGIMVFALSKTAASSLSRDISERNFLKEYLAIIHGEPEDKSGIMKDLLFKDSRKNKSYVVKRFRKGVREAELYYSLVETKSLGNEKISLVNVELHTGRTHQIRVQFASRKMPLIGDSRYGAKDGYSGIVLWSYKIEFTHPVSREKMSFTCNPEKTNMFEEFNI